MCGRSRSGSSDRLFNLRRSRPRLGRPRIVPRVAAVTDVDVLRSSPVPGSGSLPDRRLPGRRPPPARRSGRATGRGSRAGRTARNCRGQAAATSQHDPAPAHARLSVTRAGPPPAARARPRRRSARSATTGDVAPDPRISNAGWLARDCPAPAATSKPGRPPTTRRGRTTMKTAATNQGNAGRRDSTRPARGSKLPDRQGPLRNGVHARPPGQAREDLSGSSPSPDPGDAPGPVVPGSELRGRGPSRPGAAVADPPVPTHRPEVPERSPTSPDRVVAGPALDPESDRPPSWPAGSGGPTNSTGRWPAGARNWPGAGSSRPGRSAGSGSTPGRDAGAGGGPAWSSKACWTRGPHASPCRWPGDGPRYRP
jgi:hypothetical protein